MKTILILVVIAVLTSLTKGQRLFGRRPSRNFGGRQPQSPRNQGFGGFVGGLIGEGNTRTGGNRRNSFNGNRRNNFSGNRGGNFGGNRGNRFGTGSTGGCLGPFCGQNSFGVDRRTGGLTGNTCFNGDCTQVNLLGGSNGRGGSADQGCSGARCNQINIGGGASQGCRGAECNQLNIGGGGLGGLLRPGRRQSSNQGCVGSDCRQFNLGLGQILGRKK